MHKGNDHPARADLRCEMDLSITVRRILLKVSDVAMVQSRFSVVPQRDSSGTTHSARGPGDYVLQISDVEGTLVRTFLSPAHMRAASMVRRLATLTLRLACSDDLSIELLNAPQTICLVLLRVSAFGMHRGCMARPHGCVSVSCGDPT